jgi:hypothetical protein
LRGKEKIFTTIPTQPRNLIPHRKSFASEKEIIKPVLHASKITGIRK